MGDAVDCRVPGHMAGLIDSADRRRAAASAHLSPDEARALLSAAGLGSTVHASHDGLLDSGLAKLRVISRGDGV